MEPTDLTIEILKDIRSAVRATNDRLDATNDRLDATNDRLEGLADRMTNTEVRLATAIVALGGTLTEVRDLLREQTSMRDTVADHDRRIASLERRAGK
jgi:ABC-type transporter Mla subunit MlaD